jgi:hypothetical protein
MASYYEPVIAHLNVPENRIKYCYQFMHSFEHTDRAMYGLALQRACDWIAVAADEESHY